MLSGSFFSNKRRHLDITATARDYLCVSQLLDTLYHLRFFRLMSTLRETWILPINSTIWRHDDVILRLCVNQVIPTTRGVATFSTSCMPALSMPF